MIIDKRFVMATVAVAVMLATFTSGGASAGDDVPLPKCSIKPVAVTVADDATSVKAEASASCVLGLLTVFQVSLSVEVTGAKCKENLAEVVPNTDVIPTWVKVRVMLACNPGDKGAISSKTQVKMLGPNNVKLGAYAFGDTLTDEVMTHTHCWNVNFVAGVGKLPTIDPVHGEGTVFGTSDDNNDGTSQAQSDHEIYG